MIKAVYTADQSENIHSFRVSGHSGSAVKGEDLICAAVSAIVFGTCNALDELECNAQVKVSDNRIALNKCGTDSRTQTVLKTMICQLKTIEEDYSEYLSIEQKNGGVKQ